ncbi:MAG TPA: archaellin/type IV pilin N-terminal domain-containing protein [Candidatus Methanoperedens sp.]|jgi:flagellin FlaB
MKANQKFLMDNERGDIGVGTLIIFIAMVLVAAVAATVLIYTTGSLQQKATKTSKEATQQISSNIVVEQVIGDRIDITNPNIQDIILRLKPDVGTTSIDLRQVIVSVQDETNRLDIYHINASSNLSNYTYTSKAIRDADGSFTDVPVMNSGDLIEIKLELVSSLNGMLLPPRKTFLLSLSQERGQAVNLEITTPNSYGINQYVQLYP